MKMDNTRIIKIIANLENEIEEFSKNIESDLKDYESDLQNIIEIIDKIRESWSGSWIGYHADLYYEDFERPTINVRFDSEWGLTRIEQPGWKEKKYEDVVDFINRKYSGLSLDDIKKCLLIIEKETLHTKICSDLSFIRGFKNFGKEIEILDEIEKIVWKFPPADIVKAIRPRNYVTRDNLAMHQGLQVAPHIQCEAQVLSIFSGIKSLEKFIKLARRLLRQIKMRFSVKNLKNLDNYAIEKVRLLCKRFHMVVRTFKNRDRGREPLKINDEYDVQYILHTLLIVFFDDVRPEEWTPSYAGSSSKMDFLLKDEKVAVETKNVGNNLNDRKIGEELSVDIAKYRSHPDCETLICFVYDPEERLENPKGLEKDLNDLSSEELRVLVFIEP